MDKPLPQDEQGNIETHHLEPKIENEGSQDAKVGADGQNGDQQVGVARGVPAQLSQACSSDVEPSTCFSYSNIKQPVPCALLDNNFFRAWSLSLPTQITSLTPSAGGSSEGGVATDRVLLPTITVGSKVGRSSGAQLTRPSSGGTLFSWGLKEWRLARNKGAWGVRARAGSYRLPGGGEQADGSGVIIAWACSAAAEQVPADCAVRATDVYTDCWDSTHGPDDAESVHA